MLTLLSTAALALVGCAAEVPAPTEQLSTDGPAFTGPPPSLTLDRMSYVAVGDSNVARRQWRFAIVATLRNDAAEVLYPATCDGRTPMVNLGSYSSGSAYEPVDACVGLAGIELQPYAVRVDTISIVGPSIFDGKTGVGYGALSGTLALSYTLATCTDVDRCRAGIVSATSGPFTVTALP